MSESPRENYSIHKVDVSVAYSYEVERRKGNIGGAVNVVEITYEPMTVIKELSFHIYTPDQRDRYADNTDVTLAFRGEELATAWVNDNAVSLNDAFPGSLKINWCYATKVTPTIVRVAYPWRVS